MKNHIGAVFAVLFLLFALVQYNDPDPWLWILIYGVVALLSLLQWKSLVSIKVLLFCAIGLLVFMCTYVPDLINWAKQGFPSITSEMKTEDMHIELVRESLGLGISSAALFYLYKISNKI